MIGWGTPAAYGQKLDLRYEPIGKTVNLDADNADIRQIVRKLVNASGITLYRMDPGIDANVTLTLRNTPFDLALQTALARAGAEHDYKDGLLRIYRVGKRPGDDSGTGRGGGRLDNNNRSGGDYRPGATIPAIFLSRVALRMNDSPIATVMANLSRQSGVRVTATSETPLDLRVTMVASNEPLWAVLQRIAQASRLKVEVAGDREAIFSPLASVQSRDRDGHVGNSRDAGVCRHCRYDLKREWKYCPMCGDRTGR